MSILVTVSARHVTQVISYKLLFYSLVNYVFAAFANGALNALNLLFITNYSFAKVANSTANYGMVLVK